MLVLPELGLTGYTCGDLFFSLTTLVGGAERALERVLRETARRDHGGGGRACRCSRATGCSTPRPCCSRGACSASCRRRSCPATRSTTRSAGSRPRAKPRADVLRLAGHEVPFGTDLLFRLPGEEAVTLAVEICEDLWAPIPPSSRHAVAGASVILNPSASNDLVGKAEYRRELVRQQSGRTLAAYVYANAGVHESTTDLVFGGHLLIAENGVLLAEGERFRRDGELVVTRRRRRAAARGARAPDLVRRRPCTTAGPATAAWRSRRSRPPRPHRLLRAIDPHPFVPARSRDARRALPRGVPGPDRGRSRAGSSTSGVRRVRARPLGRARLDARAPRVRAHLRPAGPAAPGHPGGHAAGLRAPRAARSTARGAWPRRYGAELREIDIRPACEQHIKDIGLDPRTARAPPTRTCRRASARRS